jgi:glyoxylase-like metal-dependent hydrolase (beta-lactamase superfamily II)
VSGTGEEVQVARAADVAAGPTVHAVTVGAFQENCYLVVDPSTRAAALVDPGAEGHRIVAMVREAGVTLEAIWLTHAHLDHVGAIADVKRVWDVPVHLHPLDHPTFDLAPRAARMYGLPWAPQPLPDRELAEGEPLALGALRFDVMHTPGHAPGHVTIHGHGLAIVGDCLFYGSVGRTDLPGANPKDLTQSLARIAALPPASRVLSGHGPESTIARELAENSFLNGGARVLGG